MMKEQKIELTFLSYAHENLDRGRQVDESLKERKVAAWFDKVDLGTGI